MKLELFNSNDYEKLYSFMEPLWLETYKNVIPLKQIYHLLHYYFDVENINEFISKGYTYYNLYDDEFIGVVVIHEMDHEVYLDKLYLVPNKRGMGYPKMVFNELLKKNKPITLNVNQNNERACKCYFKNGFEILEEQIIDLGDGMINKDYKLIKRS